MAIRVIDDDLALEIYDAVQKKSKRSFDDYTRSRELPRHKIEGQLAFYLDELLGFAAEDLGLAQSVVLSQVIDAGIVSWFGGLPLDKQKKLGFSIDGATRDQPLHDELAALKLERDELRREISRLQIANEELLDQIPDDKSQKVSLQPLYLMESDSESRYTEMTSHLLSGGNGRNDQQKAQKPKKRSRPSRRRR